MTVLKPIFTIISLMMTLNVLAQNTPKLNETFRVSKPFPTSNASIYPFDGKLILLQYDKKNMNFSLAEGPDYSIKKTNSQPSIPLEKTENSIGTRRIGNKLFKINYIIDKKSGAFDLYGYEIDADKLTISSTKKSILSASKSAVDKDMKAYVMFVSINSSVLNFETLPSNDGKLLHLLYYAENSETSRVLQVITIDDNLEIVNKNSYKLNPLRGKDIAIDSYKVGDDGTIYNLRHIKFKEDKKKYSHLDLEILHPDEGPTIHQLSIPEGDMKTCAIYYSPVANLIIAGTYEKGTEVGMFATVCENGELGEMSYLPVPNELVKTYRNEKQVTALDKTLGENKKILNYLQIKHASASADGSLHLYSEVEYEVHKTDSRGNTSITYVLEDAYYGSIDIHDNVKWINKIPKRSASAYGSETVFDSNDAHDVLIYLEDYRNENLKIDEPAHTMQSNLPGMVVAYIIEKKTGEAKKTALFNMKDVNGIEVYNYIRNRLYKTGANEYSIKLYAKNKEDVIITTIVPM